MLDEVQALVKIGRVDDRENPVRVSCAFHVTENHVDRNLLFQGVRAQRVRTRKVDQLERFLADPERTDMPLDRNARVITDSLTQSGQSIEQGALAGIGITDDRNTCVGSTACGNLVGGNAYFGGLSHRGLQQGTRRTAWPAPGAARFRGQTT